MAERNLETILETGRSKDNLLCSRVWRLAFLLSDPFEPGEYLIEADVSLAQGGQHK